MSGPASPLLRLPARSMGLKLLLVCALALVMSIPAFFVSGLLRDRTERAQEVTQELGALVGGPQTFLGPVLAIPYSTPSQDAKLVTRGVFVVFPASGEAKIDARSEVRRRSLFEVPVYQADIAFHSRFDLAGITALAPEGATLDWSRAEFLIGATDARGAQADIVFAAAGQPRPVAPAVIVPEIASEEGASPGPRRHEPSTLRFFGASAAGLALPDARFDATARLKFSGSQRFAVLAYGKTTTVEARADWPHPSFDGGFLPVRRDVGADGFTASWRVPFIARGVPAQGPADALTRLGRTALGVSLVEPANPYQSVARSLKYALMFVGLVFLAYFLFETTQGKRVHPAQYVLIGLAQIIFYLLLLSIAERLGFDAAFVIAAGATVGLISAYAGWVFQSRKQGFTALAAFTLLYGLIYVLMRLEDWALLVGAVTSFAAIAAVMYFTRRLDWYGVSAPAAQPEGPLKERP